MRLIFSFLSIIYIAGIFLLAGSSVVSDLSTFNPYSVLHIPLYGILTVLLIFSVLRREMRPALWQHRYCSVGSLFHWGRLPNNLLTRFSIVGLIALGIGIADEIHQAYVPGRDASVTDVLLDMVGIILALLFIPWLLKTKKPVTQ